MILKHRDTEVLRFDWETSSGVKNVELNPAAERFLPLAFRDKVRKDPASLRYELELWLLNRTPPVSRAGIRETLKHLGFRVEDPSWKRDLITFGRGLSLNDVHWIVKDDSAEKWAAANLYDNPFSTVVASMAFTGDRRVDIRDASSSPEYSTDGNLRKCWRRIDGQVLLFKGGGHDDGGFAERNAVGLEPFSEYFAAQVAEAMRLPHVPYGLAQFKHSLCSTCPIFTSQKRAFLPLRGLIDSQAVCQDVRFAELFFFDAVIFNTDRHLGNFGFLVDNDANEICGLAPIFDNGRGLFSQAFSHPGKRDDELQDLRRFLARREPKLYPNWLDIPGGVTDALIERLVGLENFEFKPHPKFAWPDNRLEVSQYFLRNRIEKIIRYREKADRYLKVGVKDVTINPTITDNVLKQAAVAEDLSRELKATLKSFPKASMEKLAILFKTSTRTIARHIKALQEAGELRRVGSRKTGHWQVIDSLSKKG